MSLFMHQALIFIAASIVLVPLFKYLGFGSILGYLFAGLIIGPFGLSLITDSESVLHFAEIGVVILLFVIGLEMKPQKLWSMRNQLFGLGGLQIVVCSILFYLAAIAMQIDPLIALVLGFAFSLSSTAYAIQTLNEKKQFNTEYGQASFSILLMQDLAAIPALALIPILFKNEVNQHKPISILLLVGVFVGLILAAKYLIRPSFRIVANSKTKEIFTALAIFIVFGVATIMEQIGLSAALGTFLAGLLLAESEYRHEIENNIEPFKALLMGLFFIAIGMSVNLNILFAQPILFLLISLGYLLIKFLVIVTSAKIFKQKKHSAIRVGLTIAQGGEFAFVLFSLINMIQPNYSLLLEKASVVITLSMLLNPLIFYIYEKTFVKFKSVTDVSYDQIENEHPQIIVAGYGRFGQIFGRILTAQKIPFVAIDYDSDHIELVRRFGTKVYFGDATREELLLSAGINEAKYLIIAIDDVDSSVELAKMVKQQFPHIKIYSRARNRGHVYDLLDAGVDKIKRETIDSSVNLVKNLLEDLQVKNAQTVVDLFLEHDEKMLLEQYKVRSDEKNLISVSKQGVDQLAAVLSDDERLKN